MHRKLIKVVRGNPCNVHLFIMFLLLNHVNILTVQNRNEYKTKKIPSRMHSRRTKSTGLSNQRSDLILAGPLGTLNFLCWNTSGAGPVCSLSSQPHTSINKILSWIMPCFFMIATSCALLLLQTISRYLSVFSTIFQRIPDLTSHIPHSWINLSIVHAPMLLSQALFRGF